MEINHNLHSAQLFFFIYNKLYVLYYSIPKRVEAFNSKENCLYGWRSLKVLIKFKLDSFQFFTHIFFTISISLTRYWMDREKHNYIRIWMWIMQTKAKPMSKKWKKKKKNESKKN